MPKGLQQKGILRREKMLHAAVQLFFQNGYEKTTTAAIARAADMAPSSFVAAFENKEALLLTLVKDMFDDQFASADQMLDGVKDPVLLYGIETAVQMYIAEYSEALREIYIEAYSLPTTSEYIYAATAERLGQIFGVYLPDAQSKDFYEMEIASGGIMRAYMARPCDLYFTMERKLRRFLRCTLTIYSVPEEKQVQVIETVLGMDLGAVAQKVLDNLMRRTEQGFEKSV